ncbi:transposable element Tcb2 transposase [Trichonephila clavipes]|nr:transposable element Tcb2 transposase [Trichonephila clavipes]
MEQNGTDCVSSRTLRRRLAEGHLGSWSPLRVLSLTPTHQRLHLEWSRARGNWTAVEWKQVVFKRRANPNSISAVMTIVLVYGVPAVNASIHPAFTLQRHTAPTAGVMV